MAVVRGWPSGRSDGVAAADRRQQVLRHLSEPAARLRGDSPWKYDLPAVQLENSRWLDLLLVTGIVGGGLLAGTLLRSPDPIALSPAAVESFQALGVDVDGFMVPEVLFSAGALTSWRALAILVGGGFLVGFGSHWAGGCTSGHAITGLATLQLASLVAVVGFFAGGLLSANFLLPFLLGR